MAESQGRTVTATSSDVSSVPPPDAPLSAVEVDVAAATSTSTTPRFTDFHPTASALPEQDDER